MFDEKRIRLTGNGGRKHVGFAGFVATLASFAFAAVVLTGALMISLLVFAIAATLGLLIGGYAFWKTRAIRKQFREWGQGGHIIEGEVVQRRTEDRRVEA